MQTSSIRGQVSRLATTVKADEERATARAEGAEDPVRAARPRVAGARLAAYLLTVFLLVTINFFLPRALPGDPIDALLDPSQSAYLQNEQLRAEITAYYGLDRPIGVQYVDYLAALGRGDLGTSIRYNVPVANLLAERLPWTLLLVGAGLTLAVTVGLSAGVHSGWRRGERADRRLLTLFLGLSHFPAFFLASIALFVFAVKLGWVPLAGARTPFASGQGLLGQVTDVAHHLVLPACVMAVSLAADYYLVMRAGMVGELGADHLLGGRVKGLRERRLKYRYAARNALLPAVSLVAARVGTAVSGLTIFVETVFAYPGIGRLVFDAVSFRDYPVLQACFLVLALLTLTANLAADLGYARLDPRVSR